MMQSLGNMVAKSCRKGYCDYSSASKKDVTTSKKIVDQLVGFIFKGAFCGAGYVLRGLMSSPVSKELQEDEERITKAIQRTQRAIAESDARRSKR